MLDDGWHSALTVLDALPHPVMLLDRSRRILFANRALRATLPPDEEILGKPCFAGIPALDSPPLPESLLDEVILRGEPTEKEIFVPSEGGGSVPPSAGRWVKLAISPTELRTTDGGVGLLLSIQDVTAEREASARVLESEEKYRRLFSEMNYGLALHKILLDDTGRPIDYRFLELNPAFEKLTGLTREQTLGRSAREVLPALESSWIERYAQVALTGVPIHFEEYSADLGRFYEVTAYSPQEGHFATVFSDVTERRRADLALEESERKLRHLLQASPTVTYSLVDKQDGLQPNWVSENVCRLLGYKAEEILAPDWWSQHLHPDERARLGADADALLERGEQSREIRLRHKDGTYRWIRDRQRISQGEGEAADVVGSWADITEIKEAELALIEAEERYRQLVENSPYGIVTHVRGRIVYANPRAVQVVGANELSEMLNRSVLEFLHPDFHDEVRGRFKEMGSHQQPLPMHELRVVRLDGTEVEVETTSIPFDLHGQLAVYSIFRDITDRKQAERDLRESEEKLRQSQKLEAVGSLAGGVAHDFNNLLTAIAGFAQLVGERVDLPPGVADDVQEIMRAAERANSLTRQLLAFSRRQALRPRVLDLNQTVLETDKLLRRVLGEDIDLEVKLEPELWRVEVDPHQIEQVLLNLAINARDAMPSGGKLTIETANVELDESYVATHLAVQPGPHVLLAVSDNGCGMSPGVLEHVFEPFFTTKEVGRGTGLGLSTIYGIVKQSGGNIWVYSEEGEGTTFKIYFPRTEKPAEAEEPARDEDSAVRQAGNQVILLVEDEPAVRTLAARVLGKQGYLVLQADSPADAQALLLKYSGPIHLILTDVVLPGQSGRELVEELSERWPEAKALYMSGYTRNAIVHDGRLDSGVAFIEKPFAPRVLVDRVQDVLE